MSDINQSLDEIMKTLTITKKVSSYLYQIKQYLVLNVEDVTIQVGDYDEMDSSISYQAELVWIFEPPGTTIDNFDRMMLCGVLQQIVDHRRLQGDSIVILKSSNTDTLWVPLVVDLGFKIKARRVVDEETSLLLYVGTVDDIMKNCQKFIYCDYDSEAKTDPCLCTEVKKGENEKIDLRCVTECVSGKQCTRNASSQNESGRCAFHYNRISQPCIIIDIAKNFELKGNSGEGGSGTVRVYKPRKDNMFQLNSYKLVAIKEWRNVIADRDLALFHEEVRILRELNHHHIGRYLGCFLNNKTQKMNIIMEYIEGGDFIDYLNSHGPFATQKKQLPSVQSLIEIFRQIANALLHMHKNKYYHRDLKPENIMISIKNKPTAKLIDFGLTCTMLDVKNVSLNCRKSGGTPEYIDKQLFVRITQKSDISQTDLSDALQAADWFAFAQMVYIATFTRHRIKIRDTSPLSEYKVLTTEETNTLKTRYNDTKFTDFIIGVLKGGLNVLETMTNEKVVKAFMQWAQ